MSVKRVVMFFIKALKWLLLIIISLISFLWAAEYIADKYFDNAAKKDSCLDSGGAWDYERDICIFGPEDPRTKKSECEYLKGIWNFEQKKCMHKPSTL